MQSLVLFWFRRDLRLEDNHGLSEALKSGFQVLPVFIFDEEILKDLQDRSDPRVTFIHQAVSRLHADLRQAGSGLLIRFGTPETVFAELLKQFPVHAIYTNRDYEPYALDRDARIRNLAEANGASLLTFKDQVIFEYDEVLKDDGKPYTVYTPYSKRWRQRWNVTAPESYPSEKNLKALLPVQTKLNVPSLSEIGFTASPIPLPDPKWKEEIIRNYHTTRDFPGQEGTSRLGIHLRFGTVSVRKLARETATLSDVFLGELIWREFFMMILAHFPHVVHSPFKSQYANIPWRNAPEDFEKWKQGMTGFPLVDAGMRELNATGHQHNRVRMVTANFLVKDLLIDWRMGEAYFAEKLLDFELASNNGNWQWCAGCGCDAAPYFRIFNPESQMQKFDPQLSYIRKWVPEYGTPAYPAPMLDHSMARERCLRVFKEALAEFKVQT